MDFIRKKLKHKHHFFFWVGMHYCAKESQSKRLLIWLQLLFRDITSRKFLPFWQIWPDIKFLSNVLPFPQWYFCIFILVPLTKVRPFPYLCLLVSHYPGWSHCSHHPSNPKTMATMASRIFRHLSYSACLELFQPLHAMILERNCCLDKSSEVIGYKSFRLLEFRSYGSMTLIDRERPGW